MVRKIFTLLFCFALIGASFASPTVQAASWTSKVDPWLLTQGETLAPGESIEFLVVLKEKGDLSAINPAWTKLEKATYTYETLFDVARSTQGPVLERLTSFGAETRSFWITNMVWARGSWDAVRASASLSEVAMVYGNPQVYNDMPVQTAPAPDDADAIEWNITKVNADDVWNLGITGEGAVIGGQDTGYQWDHPALIDQYRGWNGSSADHDYNWHDAIHEDNFTCDGDSPFPCDDYGHGTHTMGTMVGDDGGPNQIGMAPGAKWIGCRNMDDGNGTPASYTECFEWFVAPYPVGGTPDQGDPAYAPDVISNSWGCPTSEGCAASTLLEVVQNVRSAGIMVVVSAGNAGSSCSTVNDPPGIYDESFSVGSTNSADTISGFSSRGPAEWDGNQYLKPDISAPGDGVRSAYPGNGYTTMSGTSMAAPHVAGLVGLLISADPALSGQVDLMEEIIELSALERTSAQTCGGIPGDQIPNNTYGWGRIDALAAVQAMDFPPVAGFTAPGSAFVGEPVQFTDTTTGPGPFTYLWDFGDGVGTSTESDPIYTYPAAGIFTVTQTVSNTAGTDSYSGTIEILTPLVEVTAITLTLETTGTLLPGDLADFLAEIAPADVTVPVSYTIDFGDGTALVTGATDDLTIAFTHVYTQASSYDVTIAAWNEGMLPGEAVTDTVQVEVSGPLTQDYKIYLPLALGSGEE